MSYHRTSLGAGPIPFHQSGAAPFGMPMPIQAPGPGIPGPTMPSSIYPTTNLRWGDPVTVTGPFAGQFQGNVRVKFAGAPWQAPAILGPFQATVQVPDGAQTGACVVEINGRVAFGTQCSVVPGGALRGRLAERKDTRAWKDFGPKDLNGYHAAGDLIDLGPEARRQAAGGSTTVRPRTTTAPRVRVAATPVPGAPVPASTKVPVLLVAGIGAAAVLGYVVWKKRRRTQ